MLTDKDSQRRQGSEKTLGRDAVAIGDTARFAADDHLCTTLYRPGLVDTRPNIIDAACTRCRDGVNACPVPNTINLRSLQVNPQTCQRGLLCFDACLEGTIAVKGMSGKVADTHV